MKEVEILNQEGDTEYRENEMLANLILSENKKLGDRTNIFSLAETIFVSAFVGLVTSDNGLPGLFAWFPIIICSAGIAFSIYWILQSKEQKNNIIEPLRVETEKRTAATSFKVYNKFAKKSIGSALTKYEWLPIGFVIVWSLLLTVYIIYVVGFVLF